eukprot:gb/GEZN01012364.1/.p1 GENE.gb/GEZN01012364.1/~~gb/GEZN01012364.1/.p1  ORF type:complete len:235 (-),score=52.71 gb/GEZN01012364.1/:245-949(-)
MISDENTSPEVRLAPTAAGKVMKEIRKLLKHPPEGMKVFVDDGNIAEIHADIDGPVNTPFEGGVFRVKLSLSSDFPNSPPKGTFVTKIFHPNVSKLGEICVNTLKKDWKPALGIEHVLLVIRCLLICPNPASALNEEAGKLLMEHYEDYSRRAKLMTKIHAMPQDAGAAADELKENKSQQNTQTDNNEGSSSEPSESSSSSSDASKKKAKKRTGKKESGVVPGAAAKQKARKRL